MGFFNPGDVDEGLRDVSCCETACIVGALCVQHLTSETTMTYSLLFPFHVPLGLIFPFALLFFCPHSYQMFGVVKRPSMPVFYMYSTSQFSAYGSGWTRVVLSSLNSTSHCRSLSPLAFLVYCFKFALNT